MPIFERITLPINLVFKPKICRKKSKSLILKFLENSKYKTKLKVINPTLNFTISEPEVVSTMAVISGIMFTTDLKEMRKKLKRKGKYSSASNQFRKSKRRKLKIIKGTGRSSKFAIAIFVVVIIITADCFFIRKSEFNL